MKKIVIDARMYGLEHAGIGRYVTNLLKGISKLKETDLSFSLLVLKEKLTEIKADLGNQFKYFPVKSKHYSFWEQIEIPLILQRIKPDLVHFPHFNASIFYSGKFVVTIHDLIKHYFRGKETTTRKPWLYWLKYLAYRLEVGFSLKKSKLIFVPSDFWRNRLIKDFDIAKEKIIVTSEAVDPKIIISSNNRNNKKSIFLNTFSVKKPFFIYTGSVYPHKNIERLLSAIKKIDQVQLAIVSSRNFFTQRLTNRVKKMGLEQRVKLLGFVNDQDLVHLYRKAEALVQPSLMEGFGLTGLEAMTADCPVLSSNSSCLPEVYGQAALYFNPLDVNDITDKLRLILGNKKLKKKLIKKGREQVKKYSWKKTAKETVKGYKKVL